MKILKELGLSEAQAKKILLERKRVKPKVLRRYFSDEVIRFGIVSDTHLGSLYERLDELHTFYSICKKKEIEVVLHAGDIIDGNGKMYRGHLNEIHTYGAERQVKWVEKNYPKIKGITTYFITGNHCCSFYNDNGIDVGHLSSKPDQIWNILVNMRLHFILARHGYGLFILQVARHTHSRIRCRNTASRYPQGRNQIF